MESLVKMLQQQTVPHHPLMGIRGVRDAKETEENCPYEDQMLRVDNQI